VEVDNVVLSLAVLARIFHGASSEDSSMMARKAVEVAGVGADEVDLLDALDDVWAASVLAGTIVMRDTLPVHPLSPKERSVFWEMDEDEKLVLAATIPDEEYDVPSRYRDHSLVARGKKNAKKRRRWDKP